MKYLYCKEVIGLFGITFFNNVATSILKHVFIHEKYFVHCYWNEIRHYGEYSNTLLEGANFGLKHSSISTHPRLSMDSSMVILSVHSDKYVVKTNGTVICDNKRHCLKYQHSVHDKLTIVASSILSFLMTHAKRYRTK